MATELLDDTYAGDADAAEGQERHPAETLLGFIESENIAADLEDEVLGLLGQKVVREYDIDKTSRADWEKTVGDAINMAMQVAEPKTYPWPNASNIKFPLMTTAAIQFAARAYPAIVPGSNPVKAKVQGRDKGVPEIGPDGQPATEMGEDGKPQPVWKIKPGAKRKKADRIATHMSYQLTEEMEEWEEDTDKLLAILPIVGWCVRKVSFSRDLGRNVSALVDPLKIVWNYHAKSFERAPRVTEIIDLYPQEIIERQRSGTFLDVELPLVKGDDLDAPHEFLEQHRKMDLDEDGLEEPYIVTVHKDSSKVVRIVARFETKGVMLNRQGEIAKIEPVKYYTKYPFLPAPDGSAYDMGFGALLGPISKATNAAINQMLDAGHRQNVGGGFINSGLRLKGGTLRFKIGEYKMVKVPAGSSMRDAVYDMQHPGPSPVLFELLGLLIEAGRDISSVKDVLTGDSPGPNETATTTLARIEQGMKVFTAIYKRIFRALKSEFRKIAALNAIYLDPETYFTLLDTEYVVGPEDYDETGLDVVPVADPNSVSDMQKLHRAQFLWGFRQDPLMNGKEINRRVLEAASIEDIDDLFDNQPPPPPLELIEKMHQADMDKARLQMDAERMAADIAEIESRIILNLAKAEGEEAGKQIEQYKMQMREITERIKAHAQVERGRLQGVADRPGNANGPQVPQAPGGPLAPGVGAGPGVDPGIPGGGGPAVGP